MNRSNTIALDREEPFMERLKNSPKMIAGILIGVVVLIVIIILIILYATSEGATFAPPSQSLAYSLRAPFYNRGLITKM